MTVTVDGLGRDWVGTGSGLGRSTNVRNKGTKNPTNRMDQWDDSLML
jgi:hypothetical protein